MNNIFLTLFTTFVREQKLADTRVQLNTEQWNELYRLSMLHHVSPIIFEAASKLDCFRSMPQELCFSWRRNTMALVARQTQMTELFLLLYKEMRQAGIHPIVVKGFICRNLYHKPDYRMSSDEDLLIQKGDFWKVDQFLRERGFCKENTDEELEQNMKMLHEVGYRNPVNGLYLEIHLSLFPEESGAYGHWNLYFENVFANSMEIKVRDFEVRTLNPTDHFLYLLCHSLKHFLHSGFGVRQLFDIVLFAENYGNQIDWEHIFKVTKTEEIYLFMVNLFDIGVRHLEFDLEKAAYPEKLAKNLDSEALLEDLLAAGVYGGSSEERHHSANITLAAANKKEQMGGIRASLFPKYEYMSMKYEYVKRHRWLLPAGWLHRILGHIFSKNKIDNKAIIQVGNQRVYLLRKYGVIK